MNDNYFGDAKDDGREPVLKIKFPLRPLNVIEGAIVGAMGEAMALQGHRAPMVFLKDDTFANADEYAAIYGEPLSAFEAIAMRDIVFGEVQEKFRRQLIVARECDGTMDDYLLRCEAEGIEPLLTKGI